MQSAETPDLIGRAAELASLDEVVASLEQGHGSVLTVEGPAGTGKTRLLTHLVDRSPVAHHARAVELDAHLPLGVAGRLLDAPLQDFAWRPGPISGTTLAEAGAGPMYGLARAVVDLVAAHGPRVLVVDDAQWADPQTLDLVTYLAGMTSDLPLIVAIGARSGLIGDVLNRIGSTPHMTRLELADLPPDQAATLVRARLPDTTDALVDMCVRVTGGNPMLLHELTTAIAASGTASHPQTAERIAGMAPRTVTDGVLTRLGQLGVPAADLARAVAVLGDGASLHHAARLAELDPDAAAAAADRLVEAAVLTSEQGLSFLHPLLADAVLRDMGPFTLARRYRQAADVVAADGLVDRAGAYLLRTDPTGDPHVVDLLTAAGEHALAKGDPRNAASLLGRAIAEPPAAPLRPAVLLSLARAEAASGDPKALDHLDEALRTVPDPRVRAETRHGLSQLLHLRGDFAGAVRAAETALAELPDDDPLRDRLDAGWLLAAGMLPETYQRSLEVTRELTEAAVEGRRPTHPVLSAIAALHLLCTGDDPAFATELAEAALQDSFDVNGAGAGYALSVLAWTGQLTRLAAATDLVDAAAAAEHSLLGAALSSHWRGRERLDRGDLTTAHDHVLRARAAEDLGWQVYRPLTAALLAEIRWESGDVEGAAAATRDTGDDAYDPILRHARGRVALARGDFRTALDEFAVTGQVLQDMWRIDGSIVVPWRSGVALATHGLGDADRALDESSIAVETARAAGISIVLARALRTHGLIVGGEEGVDLLREASEVAAATESVLEQVRTAVEWGAALRRIGARGEARAVLASAREQAESVGLIALAARARDEQRASGARPRRVSLTGPESLTPSESRIASLAASGATNRDIAAQLYLSPKTVSWHLSAVFRKLDVSDRKDLPGVIELHLQQTDPAGVEGEG